MEIELNGKRIKYEDGELYYWYSHSAGFPLKTPKWRKFKHTIANNQNRLYKTIMVNRRQFKVHRVIYYIHNPQWDIWDSSQSNLIDHIDGDSLNNNIENLREATHQQNMWNQHLKGYHKTDWNTYKLELRCGGVMFNKTYKTEQEAIDAVKAFRLKYQRWS